MEELPPAPLHHPLRMPLYANDREGSMGDGFDGAVRCPADRKKAVSKSVNLLMMGGIHESAASIELVEKIRPVAADVINIMILILTIPLMKSGIFGMLADSTAKMNIDDLKSFTDSKYGFFPLQKQFQRLKLKNVQLRINLPGTVVFLPEEGRSDIAAAGQQQAAAVLTCFRV